MKTFTTLQDLAACAGQDVASSDWMAITQEQVNLFAQATGDHQWIHIDVERARQGPFKTTIAHGFLTLSLLPVFFDSALRVEHFLTTCRFCSQSVSLLVWPASLTVLPHLPV